MAHNTVRFHTSIFDLDLGTTPDVRCVIRSLIITLGICAGFTIPASAQITYEGGKPAAQSTPGTFNIPISEGQQTGGNVFHSFGTFGLPTNQVANFEANSSVQNILGRVTGGAPSAIDGTIRVTGGNFSAVNLYLINPAGIIFGQNASLDVNGAFTATTARSIGFGNSQWFNALGGNIYPAGNPIDFAFTNTPGSIFNAANLKTTQPGRSVVLIGGTVISTGEIATQGKNGVQDENAGKISIVTVPGGQYVQISETGSILRFNLPIADKTKIEDTPNPNFTPPSLPTLLTGSGVNLAANGVKVENGVVKLVVNDGNGLKERSIVLGDIVTKTLTTAPGRQPNSDPFPYNGANISLNTQTGNIITTKIDTSSGAINIPENTPPGGVKGGKVSLSTQTGDILVGSIDTRSNNFGGTGGTGGDVTVNAGGLFRATGFVDTQTSIFTGGNDDLSNPLETLRGGKINITHQGTSFVVGGQASINPDRGGATLVTLTKDFAFPEGASGTVGAISTRNTNGNLQVVFKDGSFIGSDGASLAGFGITAVSRPTTDPGGTGGQTGGQTGVTPNPETQVSRQTSKDNCIPSYTAVAANPNTDPTRATGNTSSSSTDPCQSTFTIGGILQILNDKN